MERNSTAFSEISVPLSYVLLEAYRHWIFSNRGSKLVKSGAPLVNKIPNISIFFSKTLSGTKPTLTIKKAYALIDRSHKSYHCCRHSFATFMVGKTKSIFLARSITGHKSNAFERYLHVWEQMTLEAQKG